MVVVKLVAFPAMGVAVKFPGCPVGAAEIAVPKMPLGAKIG